MARPVPNHRHRGAALVLPLCILAAVTGLGWMILHEATPGRHRAGGAITAADLGVTPGETSTVVVFAHPQCPCTRTTLRNLAALGDWSASSLTVLVAGPAGAGDEWFKTETWTLAEAIPGATVRKIDERKVRDAGINTSGHTLAFDRRGALALDGGVTFGRAHDGANTGLDVLRALRTGSPVASVTRTPVFGCPLIDTPPAPTLASCDTACATDTAHP